MKILDVVQGSSAWFAARLGKVTASEADALITPLFAARKGEGVETYLCKKLCEKILNWSPDEINSFGMNQGNLIEKTALPWYNFTQDADAKTVGFCVSDCGRFGCSPDAIEEDCGVEIKSMQPPAAMKCLLRGEVPSEYLVQIHFSMLVTGFSKWRFVSFSRQLPSLVLTVHRDEAIQVKIRAALDHFFPLFETALAKINAMKSTERRA